MAPVPSTRRPGEPPIAWGAIPVLVIRRWDRDRSPVVDASSRGMMWKRTPESQSRVVDVFPSPVMVMGKSRVNGVSRAHFTTKGEGEGEGVCERVMVSRTQREAAPMAEVRVVKGRMGEVERTEEWVDERVDEWVDERVVVVGV